MSNALFQYLLEKINNIEDLSDTTCSHCIAWVVVSIYDVLQYNIILLARSGKSNFIEKQTLNTLNVVLPTKYYGVK